MTDNERMAILETKVQHLSEQLEDTHKKVDAMYELLMQARGARWVIIGMAAIGGAVASIATTMITVGGSLPK
jgi:phosphoglycerate dehydrogenase-like enzyme